MEFGKEGIEVTEKQEPKRLDVWQLDYSNESVEDLRKELQIAKAALENAHRALAGCQGNYMTLKTKYEFLLKRKNGEI